LSTAITFTSATGDYAWTMSNGSSGTGTWTAGTPITLNGFALNLNGVPKSGDTLAVVPTVSVASNNGNALAFARLTDKGIVAAAGGAGTSAPAQSITDAYASALANIGVRVQGGKTAASISSATASEAESARANKAGVNLDEEAAKLIQYQQSYQAAAKILQVAQSIFDTILQTAAR
jgi:flagellar hook-associated protein 1 FlgK